MKNSTKKILLSVFSFFIGVSIVPAINYNIDRWRVLKKDYYYAYNIPRPHPRVNANFLRTQYLIDNEENYDSVIFGSSRAYQGFGTNQLNSTLGGKWYKLTYPGGAPYEHLHNLKAILTEGARIKTVLIAIDDADMYRYRNDKELYNFYPIPISLKDWIEFYRFYLFNPITREDYNISKGNNRLERSDWTIERFSENGFLFPPLTNMGNHTKRLTNLPAHGIDLLKMENRVDETIAEIKEISNICDINNIKLILFITPRYYRTYFTRDVNVLDQYKRALAKICPYYDFTDFSSLTSDPHFWRDPSHFTSRVGELILQKIESGPKSEDPFGSYVTEDSIETHLLKIKNDSKSLLANILNSEPNLFVHPSHQE